MKVIYLQIHFMVAALALSSKNTSLLTKEMMIKDNVKPDTIRLASRCITNNKKQKRDDRSKCRQNYQ